MLDGGISKVGQILLCVIAGVSVLGIIFQFVLPKNGMPTIITQNDLVVMDKTIDGMRPMPVDADKTDEPYFEVKGEVLSTTDGFNFQDYIVRCQSRDGENLRPYVSVKNPVIPGRVGTYTVTYMLHWNGQEIVRKTEYRVVDWNNFQ